MFGRVVSTAAVRLFCITNLSYKGNFTLRAWPAALSALIGENLSVVTACIPYLKPFLDSLQSGMMDNEKLRREGQSKLYSDTESGRSQKTRETFQKPSGGKSVNYLELDPITRDDANNDGVYTGPIVPARSINVSSQSNGLDARVNREWDSESRTSRTEFIRKTTTLTLTNAPRILDERIV